MHETNAGPPRCLPALDSRFRGNDGRDGAENAIALRSRALFALPGLAITGSPSSLRAPEADGRAAAGCAGGAREATMVLIQPDAMQC